MDRSQQSSTHDRVVELLNQAALGIQGNKVDKLRTVQELVLHKEPNLLDNFLDEVLAFQSDKNVEVRKCVVGFIEEACKADWEILPKVVANLQMLLMDPAVPTIKRTIQAATQLYRLALLWLCQAKTVTELMESTWEYFTSIKKFILNQLDGDNDGIRTFVVKFIEMLILLQTHREPESLKKENDVSLDDVPLTLKIARPRKLEEEAREVMEDLIKFHGSSHISSMNLITTMSTLTTLARQRPQFMPKVVIALETLHANLPPTLAKSQVSSVRKMLKKQLLNLLSHPSSYEYHRNITTLLTDLGTSNSEIAKNLPKPEDLRKRQRLMDQDGASRPKKARMDALDKVMPVRLEESGSEDDEEEMVEIPREERATSAIDITEQFIRERLGPDLVADLVMASMSKLPDAMPNTFTYTYTPIAAAGTPDQIQHVARLLATQLTALKLGPGIDKVEKKKDEEEKTIETVLGGEIERKESGFAPLQPTGVTKLRIKSVKLSDITKPMPPPVLQLHTDLSLHRILESEKWAISGGAKEERVKLVSFLASHITVEKTEDVVNWIMRDVRSRCDLALSWLYEEYSHFQGFCRSSDLISATRSENRYDKILCSILTQLVQSGEGTDGDALVSRVFLEAPLITEAAVQLAVQFCQSASRAPVGVDVLKNLVLLRPPKQLVFLIALVELSAHENPEVRDVATEVVLELSERMSLKKIIVDYGTMYLRFLLLPQPPEMLFGGERGRPVITHEWTEEIVKVCLYLYLALLPTNHILIHELAVVYVKTSADIKRSILRVLEQPVKGMGMDSPELLTLVETCPKGAETLVTRIIHILTDKSVPSVDLVSKVRDLYQKRVSDVRFLIPVLNGLSKVEVTAALPKLIKLNPVVVKEVFNRLLGVHVESQEFSSPLTPAELLVFLHTIDPAKCDTKTIMKATGLCLAERNVYTAEVLAVVIQKLMEINPLPTLLMRTVIQSMSFHPRLTGFVMNILQRLIMKEVWKQKKVWEGFIKCCERSKGQGVTVLVQLPVAQLKEVLSSSPSLKQPLIDHIKSMTDTQRSHICSDVLELLVGATTDKSVSNENSDEKEVQVVPS